MNYSFNVETAKQYGVDEAIVIQNFQYWIKKNVANKQHENDGRTWTYNTQNALAELFPFWSRRQIQRILKSLMDMRVIMSGEYNKKGYDKTKWYAFINQKEWLETPETLNAPNGAVSDSNNAPNGALHSTKRCSPLTQTVLPIPDSKPNSKPDKAKGFDEFWIAYPRKVKKDRAVKAWEKINPSSVLLTKILCHVAKSKNSQEWKKDAGQYIPHPATWLNDKRWNDEDSETPGTGSIAGLSASEMANAI